MTTLPLSPGVHTAEAFAINDANWIVGELDATSDGLSYLAFLYCDGFMQNLGTLPGGNWSGAAAINSLGVIVGSWGNSGGGVPTPQAFIWQDWTMSNLGATIGGLANVAADINEQGNITGWRQPSITSDRQAFLLKDGRMIDLPLLPNWFRSEARALNNFNQVAGFGFITAEGFPGFVQHAFFWSEGVMTDLGVLPGTSESFARDVNDSGKVVGYCQGPGAHPFIWDNGAMRNLNTLIPPGSGIDISIAKSINNAGQIACYGSFQSHTVGLLLTPVPFPAGDLNGDYVVNTLDLGILLSSWSIPPTTPACGGAKTCPADINGDGYVNTLDLGMLLSSWTL